MVKNIKAGIVIHHPQELQLSVNGDRLSDYEFVFNHMYYERVSKAVGHDSWGVWFKQLEEVGPTFIVDIFTNSLVDYSLIARTICSNLPTDMKFQVMPPYWSYDYFCQEMAA
jgi:hypothetical protein